jgi:hypothetical protein
MGTRRILTSKRRHIDVQTQAFSKKSKTRRIFTSKQQKIKNYASCGIRTHAGVNPGELSDMARIHARPSDALESHAICGGMGKNHSAKLAP